MSLSAPEAEQPEGDDGKPARFEIPGKPRPMIREGGKWWAVWRNKVDALDYWERQFAKADEAVKRKRRTGKFEATGSAFVTFENMADAVSAERGVWFSPGPLADLWCFCPLANRHAGHPLAEPRQVHHGPGPRAAR